MHIHWRFARLQAYVIGLDFGFHQVPGYRRTVSSDSGLPGPSCRAGISRGFGGAYSGRALVSTILTVNGNSGGHGEPETATRIGLGFMSQPTRSPFVSGAGCWGECRVLGGVSMAVESTAGWGGGAPMKHVCRLVARIRL